MNLRIPFEKSIKMYLHKPFHTNIFVIEPNRNKLVNKVSHIILITFLNFCSLTVLLGQTETVWPGEINQNAKVSNVDVLYLGGAFGASGSARGGVFQVWTPQMGQSWNQTFPDGTDFIHADCNGDGVVDADDLEVIDYQYQQISGTPSSDGFLLGDPSIDPSLELDISSINITGTNSFEIDLVLGSEQNNIEQFFGIAFSIDFGDFTQYGSVESINMEVLPESWIANDNLPLTFIKENTTTAAFDGAIVRTNHQNVSGGGTIARFSIVMEDIIFGITDGTIIVNNIKMIDTNFAVSPVAASATKLGATASSTTQTVEPGVWKEWISIYPNPVKDRLLIEELDPKAKWSSLEIFHVNGSRIYQTTEYESLKQVDLINQAPGSYYLRLLTEEGFIIHDFLKY